MSWSIFCITTKGCTGPIEVVAESRKQLDDALGNIECIESIEKDEGVIITSESEAVNHRTGFPFACLPHHNHLLRPFIELLYQSRKLWFIADNEEEAKQWKDQYMSSGAQNVELKPSESDDQVDVLITLDPKQSEQVLGFVPEYEQWLGVDLDDLVYDHSA